MALGFELYIAILYALLLLLHSGFSSSHPLCTDYTAPLTLKTPLTFCPHKGSSCCNSTKDLQLQKQFQSMKILDSNCASVMKSVLCAVCDPFSAELFKIDAGFQSVPVLCNSTISEGSTQSISAGTSFCEKVWEACYCVSMSNSPFAPSQGIARTLVNSTSSKLTDLWHSKNGFCKAYGGASSIDSVCFDGDQVLLKNETVQPPNVLCLEKISDVSFINLIAHPDGSNRVFISDQQGRIWITTVPDIGSGEQLRSDALKPFLDLTDRVYADYQQGLLSIAFHPKFMENGRFFVSFNCDKSKWEGCNGLCSCNSDVNCNPSDISNSYEGYACQFYSIVSEYTANGTEVNSAMKCNKLEVRRIFTMGLPYSTQHGGQILFGPDGYLYFTMGDGGGVGDPYNFAQNKKSLLGKIMRLDVDNFPSATEIDSLGLWGNYSIPKDNPVFDLDSDLRPEIWALGLRNPWRCTFDSERPSYFLCADVGEDRYEEVDIITKGGNYGWRVYEGPYLYIPEQSPGGNTSANSINPIFPVMGYHHSSINKDIKPEGAAVMGGNFYRSMTDPCTYGRYLYADFYGEAIWTGTENPKNSGKFINEKVTFACAHDSPTQCNFIDESSTPTLGFIISFGEDNRKDAYILASGGLYRIARPSRCNYICSKENGTATGSSGSSKSSSGSSLQIQHCNLVLLFSVLVLLQELIF